MEIDEQRPSKIKSNAKTEPETHVSTGASGLLPRSTPSFPLLLFVTLSLVSFSPLLPCPSPVNGASRLTYFNSRRRGPPGRRTYRPSPPLHTCVSAEKDRLRKQVCSTGNKQHCRGGWTSLTVGNVQSVTTLKCQYMP